MRCWLVFCLFLFQGCAAMEHAIIGPPLNLPVEEVRARVNDNALKVSTLKAKAELKLASQELNGPMTCRGYVRMERPRRLRIICSKFLNTLFDVLSNGQEFWLYVPKENKVYTGLATQDLTYLGLKFSPNDVAGLLDFPAIFTGTVTRFDVQLEYWSITLSEPQGNTHLVVDRHDLRVLSYESFNPDGGLRMQVSLADYQRLKGIDIPQRIEVYWPRGQTRLGLRLSDLALNEALDPRLFYFSMPQDAEVVRIGKDAYSFGPR